MHNFIAKITVKFVYNHIDWNCKTVFELRIISLALFAEFIKFTSSVVIER